MVAWNNWTLATNVAYSSHLERLSVTELSLTTVLYFNSVEKYSNDRTVLFYPVTSPPFVGHLRRTVSHNICARTHYFTRAVYPQKPCQFFESCFCKLLTQDQEQMHPTDPTLPDARTEIHDSLPFCGQLLVEEGHQAHGHESIISIFFTTYVS